MRRNVSVPLFALLTASLLVSACGGAATPAPVATPVVQIQTQVVEITSTPGPGAPTPLPAGSIQITGAGATFPLPVYTQWTYAFQYVDPAVVINYNGVGSGAGKTAIIQNTVDFAGSDSLLSDQNYADGKDLQMYPMLAGAVVVIYNVKWNTVQGPSVGAGTPTPAPAAIPTLILDRQTLVDIYNAKVTTWNDPKIVALNPGLKDYLPAAKITAVHRSDGSGTTEIFTKSLTSFSKDWTAGGAQSVQWPVDKAGNGIGASDKEYKAAGAALVDTAEEIFAKADMIVKVKEPLPEEYGLFREDQILFTYLHLAAAPGLARELMSRKVMSVAYETIELPDRSLPCLTPMSEIAP
jgi:phosphate transport system substrate-binding protein